MIELPDHLAEFVLECMNQIEQHQGAVQEIGVRITGKRIAEVRALLHKEPAALDMIAQPVVRQKSVRLPAWTTETNEILLGYKDISPKPWKEQILPRILALRPGTTVEGAKSQLDRLVKGSKAAAAMVSAALAETPIPPADIVRGAPVEAPTPLAAIRDEWSVRPPSEIELRGKGYGR
jgi:hypothetical protein